ncbi:hypothetical protein M0802_000561 [Mischocyttarus mexicanus]|nr:hypothetical protein M0802_000561 [Mischocyttarus mexicanus]
MTHRRCHKDRWKTGNPNKALVPSDALYLLLLRLPYLNILNDIPGKIYFVTSKLILLEMVPPMEGAYLKPIKERVLLISEQKEKIKMLEPDKEEKLLENQEKKKKKKSSKVSQGQVKENVKEVIEEKEKEKEKEKKEEKKKENGREREKEKSDEKITDADNLRNNVSTDKLMTFNAISLPTEIKIKEEVGKNDLIKLSELKEAFQLFDFNCDGIIDFEDLKFTFITMGKPDVSEEQLQQMLSEIPTPIDFDAFITLFGKKVSEMDPEEVFTAALSTWDMRETGMIPEKKVRNDLQKFGDKFTIKEVDRALEEAPIYLQDDDEMIDYIKFSNNICGFQKLARARQYQKKLENP